jgi:Raf kinase inhibitor-like YbhB/YbcL family protein
MKRKLLLLLMLSLLCGTGKANSMKTKKSFTLMSNAFTHNSAIPAQYTCDGQNISPHLHWVNAPENTLSFTLIVDDPDAPKATPWVHWILFNIDPSITSLAEGMTTTSFSHGTNDFGKKNYGGPCPPSGNHHYHFKLYALDTIVDLPDGTTKEKLVKAMAGHILAQTELIGLYQRKK